MWFVWEAHWKFFTDIPKDIRGQIKTEMQWAREGYVKAEGALGEILSPNRFRAAEAFVYYHESEVRKGTAEELNSLLAGERTARKEANRKYRRRKVEEAEREKKDLLNDLRTAENDLLNAEKRLKKAKEGFSNSCKYFSRTFAAGSTENESRAKRLVIDTETTGLTPVEDELLQISIIDADSGSTLFNSYVKPFFATEWKEAENVNHISPPMVEDAPYIYELIAEINAITRNAETVIGYNTAFDVSFLEASGIMFDNVADYVDVMEDFAVIYGDYSPYHHNFKWKKLTECAKYFGYTWGSDAAHDSLADCRATLHCYREMQRDFYRKVLEVNLEMARNDIENNS